MASDKCHREGETFHGETDIQTSQAVTEVTFDTCDDL